MDNNAPSALKAAVIGVGYLGKFHAQKFAQIAGALGKPNGQGAGASSAEASVDAVTELCSQVGIVSRLGALGIPEDAIDPMAAGALKVTRLMKNNPREMTLEDVKRIYREAY